MNENTNGTRAVLIVGAGIAGATAADCLEKSGLEVHLIEKQASIGGHAARFGCKATDVCLRCNVCVADKVFRSVRSNSRIRLYAETELAELRQTTGPHAFAAVLDHRGSAAHGKTVKSEIAVDDVVVAIGFEPFQPRENSSLGWGRVPNLVTGLEAEKQLASQHRILRPSDGAAPKRVAFVQCVGSRTDEIYRSPDDTSYCSTVCCAYALRMARRLKSQAGDSAITVFYMDIQNFGSDFESFLVQCRNSMKFVRSRPYEFKAGQGGTVRVKYAPENSDGGAAVCEEEFDLVVLAIGIRPPADARAISDRLNVPVDECGFLGIKTASAFGETQRQRIHVIGACEAPKDIAGCMAQAEAVAARVLSGS